MSNILHTNTKTWFGSLVSLCLGTLLILPAFSNAQSVSISADNSAPNASSILELKSTSKGMLTPRMTTTERDAIVSPADGLLVFNITSGAFNFYESGWQVLGIVGINESASYSSANANSSISTTSTVDALASGMTLTPGAGTYAVMFNGAYSMVASGNITTQGASDLTTAYNALNSITATNTTHTPAFGSGETLNEGVYTIGAAGSLAGNLTLDALGDPNAVFIFRFAGAFSTGAGASVTLANGASACNVFWVSEGALSLGATSTIKGTLIANNGAVSAGAGSSIIGRLFSTTGAASINGSTITKPHRCTYLDLGVLSTFVMFTSAGAVGNTGSSNVTGNIGTNTGAITGFGTATVNGTIYPPGASASSGTLSIYQNDVLVASSSRSRTSSVNTADITLHAIATVSAGQAIEVRCRTESGTLTLGNRILTLTKVQ